MNLSEQRRSIRFLSIAPNVAVAAICCLVASSIASASFGSEHDQDSPDRHLVTVTLPQSQALQAAQPIEISIGRHEPIQLNSDAVIDVGPGENVTIACRYSSGLLLTTTIAARERTLLLPRIAQHHIVVNDSYGLGITAATLTLIGSAGRFSWRNGGSTDLDGAVVITAPSGTSGVIATVEAEGFGSHRQELSLHPEANTSITLEASATIVATIVDRADRFALITVQLWKLSGSRERVLETTSGTPLVISGVGSAEYRIDVSVPMRGAKSIGPVSIRPGQYLDLGAIDVTPTATLTGRILDATDAPLIGVRVRLTLPDSQHGTLAEALSDQSGNYRFVSLVPASYRIELFSKDLGWRTFPNELVSLYDGAAQERSFHWSGGCSLELTFITDAPDLQATYSVSLPVTDAATAVKVASPLLARRFPSVPCEGAAIVQRVDADGEKHSIPIEGGDNRLVIRVLPPRRQTLARFLNGAKPLSRATIWVVPRDSSETVVKSRNTNLTDDDGTAMISLPSTDDQTVYIQTAFVLSEVYRAGFELNHGVHTLSLPDTIMRGKVVDVSGSPLGGVSFGGSLILERPSAGLPRSAVTLFKGTTAPDGTFAINGLAAGKWSVHFNRGSADSAESREITVDLTRSVSQVRVSFSKH